MPRLFRDPAQAKAQRLRDPHAKPLAITFRELQIQFSLGRALQIPATAGNFGHQRRIRNSNSKTL